MSEEHTHRAHHAPPAEESPAAARPEREAWNERYAERVRVWSGAPNVELTRRIADLTPGSALDLGCGEGADAVWLARQGWKVTAVDVSDLALGRAAEHAAEAGLSEAIEFRHGNLLEDFPPGEFDLVSAQFLYPQADTAREGLLRRAVQAVAPGGVALIESHSGLPEWEQEKHSGHAGHGGHAGMKFAKPAEILASLRLADGEWDVLVCEEHERVQNGPDGTPTTRIDSTLKLRRR
jgi:SAM-dependent methyltransferase